MNTDLMFTSKTDLWGTPQALFNQLNEQYKFTLDVCATKENAKCELFFTKEQNGLIQEWRPHICWMNPPYGREIYNWVQKAYTCGTPVVCLLPARTDTKWFHSFCIKGEITFLKGRLKFGGHKHNAPFPSMIVVFNCSSNALR